MYAIVVQNEGTVRGVLIEQTIEQAREVFIIAAVESEFGPDVIDAAIDIAELDPATGYEIRQGGRAITLAPHGVSVS